MLSQCAKSDCGKPVHGRGLCSTHYRQVVRAPGFASGRHEAWGTQASEKTCKTCRGVKARSEFPRYEHTCKECKKTRYRAQYLRRRWHLKRYGLSLEQFEALSSAQEGRCAICNVDMDEGGRCVDHDHESRKVRGLLCQSCNKGLGNFRDNQAVLRRAIDYLKGDG